MCVGHQVASIARRDFIFHKYPLEWHLALGSRLVGTFAPSAASLPSQIPQPLLTPTLLRNLSFPLVAGGIKNSGSIDQQYILTHHYGVHYIFVNLLQRMYLGSLAAVGRPF